MVVVGLRKAELHKDAVHVLLDSAFCDPQPTGDACICSAFSHQPEHLTFARGEALEWLACRTRREQLDDERRIDNRAAAAEPIDALEEFLDVCDPALQQIAASLAACEQRGRVLNLDVGREHEDRDLRHLLANSLGGP